MCCTLTNLSYSFNPTDFKFWQRNNFLIKVIKSLSWCWRLWLWQDSEYWSFAIKVVALTWLYMVETALHISGDSWPEQIYMLIFSCSYSAPYWQQQITFSKEWSAPSGQMPKSASNLVRKHITPWWCCPMYVVRFRWRAWLWQDGEGWCDTMKQEIAITPPYVVESASNSMFVKSPGLKTSKDQYSITLKVPRSGLAYIRSENP